MARQPLVAGLTAAQENRDLLLDTDRREILRFRLIRRTEIGQNRKDGGSSPGFIESTADAINSFDGSVIQQVVPLDGPSTAGTAEPTTDRPRRGTDQGRDDLHEAIGAARATAAVATGDDAPFKSDERPSSDSLVEAPIADGVRRVAPAD